MFSTKDAHCTFSDPSINILSNINVNEQMRQPTDANSVIIFKCKNERWEVVGMVMTERAIFNAWVGANIISGMTLLNELKCWHLCFYATTHLYLRASTVLYLYFILPSRSSQTKKVTVVWWICKDMVLLNVILFLNVVCYSIMLSFVV
jgi:hypothetical protein